MPFGHAMFIREWVFVEVKQIQKPLSTCVPSPKPLGIMDQTMNTNTGEGNLEQPTASTRIVKVKSPVVITENASVSNPDQMKECNVCIERLPAMTSTPTFATNNSLSYNMHTRPPKVEIPHRTSTRPHAIVDYSKFMTGTEDDTSPPVRSIRWTWSERQAVQGLPLKITTLNLLPPPGRLDEKYPQQSQKRLAVKNRKESRTG